MEQLDFFDGNKILLVKCCDLLDAMTEHDRNDLNIVNLISDRMILSDELLKKRQAFIGRK